MRKYLIPLLTAILVLSAMATLYVYKFSDVTELNSTGANEKFRHSPEAEFAIPEGQIKLFQESALNGNCDAAFKLGMHHFFFTLRLHEATEWFRLAAKCPNARSKEGLIAALLAEPDQTMVAAEIDRVIVDLKNIDPDAAKRSECHDYRNCRRD